MIRAILTDVLLVGLEWNITMPQESITLRRNERTPNIQIENIENYKQKDKQHHENKKTKYKNTRKNKDRYNEKNSKYREGNREAMRQTQRKRYKRDKDKIIAKKQRKAKTEEQTTITNQPIVIHAYYILYSFHSVYSIYYSSYRDQLISLCISFHSIDF